MKKIADYLIVLAVLSTVVGIVSRFTQEPVAGIFANAFLHFATTCALISIAVLLREKK